MADAEKVIPNARHEASDVGEGFIWGAFASLLGSLIAIALLILWLFPMSLLDRTIQGPLPTYPAPRLQPDPPLDMRQFYAQELTQLNSTGWIDKAHGVVHIPIADAMRDVAHEGIPGWPTTPEKRHETVASAWPAVDDRPDPAAGNRRDRAGSRAIFLPAAQRIEVFPGSPFFMIPTAG